MASNSTLEIPKTVAYTSVGTVSTAFNLLTIIIFCKKKLVTKSAIIMAVIVANFSVSFHIGFTGAYRLALKDYLTNPVKAYICCLTVAPLLHPFSYISEGLFICIGGVERFLAINAPIWFHKEWTSKVAWKIVTTGYACVFLFVFGGFVASFYQPLATWSCITGDVFNSKYLLACQLISAIGGAFGSLFAIIALITGVWRIKKLSLLNGDACRLRKQVQLTKSMSFVSLTDFCLIGVPNALSAAKGITPNLVFPSFIRSSNANYTFCANAFAIFLALVIFNREFRDAGAKMFRGLKMPAFVARKVNPYNNG